MLIVVLLIVLFVDILIKKYSKVKALISYIVYQVTNSQCQLIRIKRDLVIKGTLSRRVADMPCK